jgi:hypothetical protein
VGNGVGVAIAGGEDRVLGCVQANMRKSPKATTNNFAPVSIRSTFSKMLLILPLSRSSS